MLTYGGTPIIPHSPQRPVCGVAIPGLYIIRKNNIEIRLNTLDNIVIVDIEDSPNQILTLVFDQTRKIMSLLWIRQ